MKDINPLPFIAICVALFIAIVIAAHRSDREYRERQRTIDVKETCEQLHAFVHNGRKYYCAPWIEADDANESAPAAQETTHA